MIAVMLLMMTTSGELDAYDTDIYNIENYLGANFGWTLLNTVKEVALALALIVAVFFILQFTVLKIPKKKLAQIGIGIGYTFLGLVIFLTAVKVIQNGSYERMKSMTCTLTYKNGILSC